MNIPRTILRPHDVHGNPRRAGTVVAMAVVSLICCGAAAPTTCNTSNDHFGPSGAEVAGVAVGVGGGIVAAVVLVEVHHSHHTLKGCVFSSPNGLELQTQNDKKTYTLAGETASIKAGDMVRFHGSRVKKIKDSSGDQTFTVEKISKDYGPCKVTVPPAP